MMWPLPLMLNTGCSPDATNVPVDPDVVQTQNGRYTIEFDPASQPFLVGELSEIDLHILLGDTTITNATVAVEPWMPDMGHGIADAPSVQTNQNIYTVGLTFSMPGYWELSFEISDPEGEDTTVVAYDVE